MTISRKYLGFGSAVLALAALAFAGMGVFHALRAPEPAPAAAQSLAPQAQSIPVAPQVQSAPMVQPAPVVAAASLRPLPDVPANAVAVPDKNLLQLAKMVDLPNAAGHPADKPQWAQAASAARKLLGGPCDCDQRNWLNHFVETASYALSGSSAEYDDSAKLLSTLGRNNDQSAAMRRQALSVR
jgi:hypothetical protein